MPLPRPLAYATLAAVLAAVFFTAVYAGLRGGRTAPPRVRGSALVDVPEAELAAIRIAAGGARVRLEKDAQGRWWRVEPGPAEGASGKVGALLDALRPLTRRATLAGPKADAAALRTYGLDEPRARLELALAGGAVIAVALGDDNGAQGVGFARAADGDVVTVPAEALQAALLAVARLLPEGALPPRPPAPFGG